MKTLRSIFHLFIIIVFISSCNVSVNRSIHIEDGETVRRSLNSVNGSITECNNKIHYLFINMVMSKIL